MGMFLVQFLLEMMTEQEVAHADRIARLEAQARDFEQTGRPEAAAYLRASAERLNVNLTGLGDTEDGIRRLLLTDATADPPPPLLALPEPSANGHADQTPPVKRGPGRPPKTA